MVEARQYLQEGKVREAQRTLAEWLRRNPEDAPARTFFFELLCFSGEWDRAERQLGILAQGDQQKELGGILYFSAIHAERSREDSAGGGARHETEASSRLRGTLNGRPFESISDIDPSAGARLEIFVAGSPVWIPFEAIESVRMEAPRKLRDTLWIPACFRTGPAFQNRELNDVLIPALYAGSSRRDSDSVRLGRETTWFEEDGRERLAGQKMLLVDDDEIPLLEIREIEMEARAASHA